MKEIECETENAFLPYADEEIEISLSCIHSLTRTAAF